MSLYQQWEKMIEEQGRSKKVDYNKFIEEYLQKEKEVYEQILADHTQTVSGTCSELAKKFGMSAPEFAGFIDGINTSLKEEINLEELTEDTHVTLDIDYEKLYWNMLDAQAEWLYTLPAWENILTEERREEITKDYKQSKIVVKPKKVGRNEPCPCGSGLKYKKCCGK